MYPSPRRRIFFEGRLAGKAFRYSFPVLLGYFAIGSAFGFLLTDSGYPWWLAPVMSIIMFAGAAQFIAVGLFAAGTTLWEAALVQLVVNARHMAYGLSMMNRFRSAGPLRWYLIFGMSDETFALLSSLPENENSAERAREQAQFMFLVTLLDQGYWVVGTAIGAVAGTFIPFDTAGIGYALTALFVVLMVEQILRVRNPAPRSDRTEVPLCWPGIFIVSAVPAVLCTVFLPSRFSLLAAMALALGFSSLLSKVNLPKNNAPEINQGPK
jgi:4-azaleucine resistance transporter AzlC